MVSLTLPGSADAAGVAVSLPGSGRGCLVLCREERMRDAGRSSGDTAGRLKTGVGGVLVVSVPASSSVVVGSVSSVSSTFTVSLNNVVAVVISDGIKAGSSPVSSAGCVGSGSPCPVNSVKVSVGASCRAVFRRACYSAWRNSSMKAVKGRTSSSFEATKGISSSAEEGVAV